MTSVGGARRLPFFWFNPNPTLVGKTPVLVSGLLLAPTAVCDCARPAIFHMKYAIWRWVASKCNPLYLPASHILHKLLQTYHSPLTTPLALFGKVNSSNCGLDEAGCGITKSFRGI